MKYTPTKDFVFFVLGITALVFGVWQFFFAPFKKAYIAEAPPQSILQYQRQVAQTERDSDNDGLKDWEEPLWKTDPKNPDTDGDGTPDGEEIKDGRSPTKAGPDDTLQSATIHAGEQKGNNASMAPNSNGDTLNLTDELGKYVAIQYMKQKQGGENAPVNTNAITAALANQITSITFGEVKPFTYDDFFIARDDEIDIELFATETLRIVQETLLNPAINAPNLLRDANVQGTDDVRAVLRPYIQAHAAAETKLLAQKVPQTYAFLYVQLLNNIEKAKQSLIAMRGAERDPVLALAGMNQYTVAYGNIAALAQQAQLQFAREGISLSYFDVVNLIGSSGSNQ